MEILFNSFRHNFLPCFGLYYIALRLKELMQCNISKGNFPRGNFFVKCVVRNLNLNMIFLLHKRFYFSTSLSSLIYNFNAKNNIKSMFYAKFKLGYCMLNNNMRNMRYIMIANLIFMLNLNINFYIEKYKLLYYSV